MLARLLKKNTIFAGSFHARWLSSRNRRMEADGTVIIEHTPVSDAPRLAPTPMVFVGSSQLENDSGSFLS